MRQTFEDEVLAPSRQRSRRRLAIATLVAAVVAALGLLATGTAPAHAAKPATESAKLLQAAKAAIFSRRRASCPALADNAR